MTKNKKLLIVLLVLLLCLIWGNSMLSREISAAISDFFKSGVNNTLNVPDGGRTETLIIRKLAHFGEFSVLGFLLSAVLKDKKSGFAKAFAFGGMAAIIDETIQIFSGRASSVLDVLLDCAGVLFGVSVMFIIEKIKKKKQKDLP